MYLPFFYARSASLPAIKSFVFDLSHEMRRHAVYDMYCNLYSNLEKYEEVHDWIEKGKAFSHSTGVLSWRVWSFAIHAMACHRMERRDFP